MCISISILGCEKYGPYSPPLQVSKLVNSVLVLTWYHQCSTSLDHVAVYVATFHFCSGTESMAHAQETGASFWYKLTVMQVTYMWFVKQEYQTMMLFFCCQSSVARA